MAILIRYLIRSHIGPFLFSFTLITGLLFLNTIAQRLDQLMGKGLPWTVLGKFALLALPHTVALTLPMSILVAVLFAFSDLTAENEITAMTGGGVNPVRLLMPLIGIGVIFAGGMFLFNDRVLPETNHALRKLLVDVNLKSPTFQLREQVLNEVVSQVEEGPRRIYFLSAVRIDPVTSVLEDIIISEAGDANARRTTYADRGVMAFNDDQTDLFLTLQDGVVLETINSKRGQFQRAEFTEQFLPIRGVSDLFESGTGSDRRGDREMSTGQLADAAREAEIQRDQYLEDMKTEVVYAVKRALGWELVGDSLVSPGAVPAGAGPAEAGRPAENRYDDDETFSGRLPNDEITRSVLLTTRTNGAQADYNRLSAIEKRVEIHKKYAIAFACVVFVLLGAPLAVRFPRGGVGMVITVSVVIFAIFWASLIGGETLADEGYVSPALAMWLPNLVLFPLGVLLVRRISTQVATARGGGWDDLLFTLASGIRRMGRRPSGAMAE
jgi:lipopolysaccharide export system permease protein